MKSFFKRFSNLHWKLAFSYVGVTLLTVLALEAVVILALDRLSVWVGDGWVSRSALDQAEQLAELAAEPLAADSPTRLAQVLDQPVGLMIKIVTIWDAELDDGDGHWLDGTRVVIGTQGRVVASNQPERYPTGSLFAEPGLPEAEKLVAETLAQGMAVSHLAEETGVFAVAVPIVGAEGAQLGALYYRRPALDTTAWSLGRLGEPLLVTTLLLLPCMVPLGLVFGFVTATGFTRRLRRLAQASNALASGDLSRRVHDPSGDEIGQLARQFDAMADRLEADTTQLRELADRNARLARQAQKLAALETRHRLARDLHDGVKQRLFGVNLATAAALNLLGADSEAARARLLEAREHSRQAQAEMQALLNELRPVGLDERGLVAALVDHLGAFERREGIAVHWQTESAEGLLLPPSCEQALFRVAQEALANVARHAQATHVTVELRVMPEAVMLQVSDDGRGFDPSAVEAGSTMGLRGMQERLSGLGGTLTVDAAPGAGTRITASLPRPVP
jgi:NarL family two-component system sensor histidine kinase LiaS